MEGEYFAERHEMTEFAVWCVCVVLQPLILFSNLHFICFSRERLATRVKLLMTKPGAETNKHYIFVNFQNELLLFQLWLQIQNYLEAQINLATKINRIESIHLVPIFFYAE